MTDGEDAREIATGLSEQYRKASPWPMLVALGFVVSELGVLLGLFPVTVGGLLLFGGTVAGILSESGYVERAWLSLVVFGAAVAGFGVLTIGLNISPDSISAVTLLDTGRPFVYRGSAISVAGAFLVAVGVTIKLAAPTRPTPP